MRGPRSRLEPEGTAKCSGSVIQFTKLSFDQSQLKIHFRSGLECECSTQFILSGSKVVLLGIDSRKETIRRAIRWVVLNGSLNLSECRCLIVTVILSRS